MNKTISHSKGISKKANIISLLFLMCISLLCSFLLKETAVSANSTGLGDIAFTWNREISKDVTLNSVISTNNYGEQRAYTISFDPTKTASYLKPLLTYGNYVMGGDIMSEMVNQVEAQGKKVVFGINGDAYDTSNGVSLGVMVANGKLISSPSTNYAVGFKSDGSVVYGNNSFVTKATFNGQTITINHVNKERKLDTETVTLLTEHFASSSLSTQAGVEVVLTVAENQVEEGLKIGKQMNLTVESVNEVSDNENKNNTVIGKGKMILSCNKSSSRYDILKQLTIGESVAVDVANSGTMDYSDVQQAIGVFHVLMLDNVETPGIRENLETHPRTAIGVKANGEVVLFQNDGRQIGWANGTTFAQMVDYMKSIGCVTLFNLDGGGSSTIAVTLPGDSTTTIINRPSDGNERANCNALLFVTDTLSTEAEVEKLHIYPDMKEGYTSKVMVLENGKLSFNVKASDSNFNAAKLDKSKLTYEVISETEKEIGTVSAEGVFTANSGAGKGKVRVKYENTIYSDLEIEVVDVVTKLSTDVTIISIAPEKTKQLHFKAEYNGIPVLCSSEALTFKLSSDTLGTVTTDGIFTSSSAQGTGELTISYKDYSLSLPVEVGKMPYLINDFEDEIEGSGWAESYIMRGGSAKISVNRNEKYIKSGDGSLRIDYDFATSPLTGTTAVEFYEQGGTTLEGQPTAIGCWVYGDGNGGWFRIQLSGGKFVGDTIINWVGWKYIETKIPTDAPFPYVLVKAVRLLGTTSICNYKKGTIYVDSLRAIYDFRNDDETAPIIDEDSINPIAGSVTGNKSQVISFSARDVKSEGIVYSGINSERTQMYINGKLIDNLQQTINDDGSVTVTYIPSALTLLRAGKQKVKVRIEDNFGNKTFKEWMFTVEGYAVELEESVPDDEKIYAGQSFSYIINPTSYKNFLYYDFAMTYSPSNLTLVGGDVNIDSRLTVENKVVDVENGIISFKLSGMSELTKDDNIPMIKLDFKAKDVVGGMTDIKVTKSIIKETGHIDSEEIILEGLDRETDYLYTISQKGSTYNSDTVLTVISKGQPVEGASFIVKTGGEILTDFNFTTDSKGQITTNYFGLYDIGTVFLITAIKDDCISNEMKLTVFDSLGTAKPERITITTGADPSSSVGISYQTTKLVETGFVKMGTTEDLLNAQTFAASSKIVTTISGGYDREYQAWGVRINGLSPETVYYYATGNDADGWSSTNSFKTAKASGDITVAFYGDIQGKYENFPAAVNQVAALADTVDLNLLAGDVVDVANSYNDWTSLYSSNGVYLSNSIWAATMGNHDSDYGGQAFTSYFYSAGNGVAGNEGADNYFTVGDAIIFNFNTEATYGYDKGYVKQKALLKEVMSKTDKKYKIVLMHRSAYPLNYNEEDVRALSSTFEECGIDLVLSGHDHIYSRTSMFNGEKTAYNSGVTYVVSGSSSGSKYYDASEGRPWKDIVYDDNNPVFSIFKITESGLNFVSYAIENGVLKTIDTFTVLPSAEISVSSEKGVIDYSGKIGVGLSKEFTITPESGYKVKNVLVNGVQTVVTDNKFTVNEISESLSITVNYEKIKYAITIVSEKGTVTGADSIDYMGESEYSVTPERGYKVKNVLVNGVQTVITDNKFTVKNVTENVSITVNFETVRTIEEKGCKSVSYGGFALIIAALALALVLTKNKKTRA